MKVEAPDDTGGRMLNCIARAQLIADTLTAFGSGDTITPRTDSLIALGAVADELADELETLQQMWAEESNKVYWSRRPKLRAALDRGRDRAAVASALAEEGGGR
jgi:hypothetical protein